MADTGWISPGTTIGSRDGGNANWINPDNVKVDDGVKSACSMGVLTRQLYVSNFGFSALVPVGATIDGIEVRVGNYNTTGTVPNPGWVDVRLVLADNSVGSENKTAEIAVMTPTPNTDEAGGPTDLWGETGTDRSDVIDSDWGWLIKGNADASTGEMEIDFMQMKVHYTPVGGAQPLYTRRHIGFLYG